MYKYDHQQLSTLFLSIIERNAERSGHEWLNEQRRIDGKQFNMAFASLPRKIGRRQLALTRAEEAAVSSVRAGLSIGHWSLDRLARVWLLLQLPADDQQKYFRQVEHLFVAAEMNELVALYSSLPVLAHPIQWVKRCAEGIRNNIGDVLESIMYRNPYPAENLDEAGWNQLVLKAFFTEKPIHEIYGLDQRRNEPLARTLCDYAHERWAAGRSVNPQLWRCVAPFIAEWNIADLRKVASSSDIIEKEAAALAAGECSFVPAKDLIPSTIASDIASGKLSWHTLTLKSTEYVLQP